jgi:hypothetical protein
MKVISYSLWGDRPLYTFGMIINVLDAPKIYPGWYVRIYYGTSVPRVIIDILGSFPYVQLRPIKEPGNRIGMFWRFYPASEPEVEVMISRDADSRLTEREAAAVNEWIQSDKGFHSMRDNESAHGTVLMGGMWGVKRGVLPTMVELIDKYEKGDFWQVDQKFLKSKIAPLVKDNMMEHDPYHGKPFPLPRVGTTFVGQPVTDDYDRVLWLYPQLSIYANGKIYVTTRGGFGNILFNVLMGESLAARLNMRVEYIKSHTGSFDRPHIGKYRVFNNLGLVLREYQPANMTPEDHQDHHVGEQQWSFYPLKLVDPNNNYIVDGFFQSYKHYPKTIIRNMKERMMTVMTRPDLVDLLSRYRTLNKQLIMLHVRRGDYLASPTIHPIPSDLYYLQSLSKFKDCDYKLLVFSDDEKFIKTWPLLKNYDHEIVNLPDVEDAFWLMTQVDHYIITNSSLSLLAYYFRQNEDAIVCLPSQWFGPRGPGYKIDDLVEITDKTHVIKSN